MLLQDHIDHGGFSDHPRCQDLLINHICIADDLVILYTPDSQSFNHIHHASWSSINIQLLRNILWTGSESFAHSNKVAWDDACLHMKERGLRFRRIADWNKASMIGHVRSIYSNENLCGLSGATNISLREGASGIWTMNEPSDFWDLKRQTFKLD
ncbi:hypothetical protein Acr_09g0002300 [Actinidia rufa]|uniref:Uncharacterized protein n=1 Tax=Actinidia rufa TaxID=165716 RepID=A0A7J0F523_9ERIC|nr:hypothetical protein Acr_09g0002300 [Actinidia rufa]